MEKVTTFIFDVDGVLVDSEHANFVSLNKALEKHLNLTIDFADDQALGPIPTFKKLEIITERFGITVSEETRAEFLKDKFEFLQSEISAGAIKFNPEAKLIFQFIKSVGCKTGIVSNARSEYLDQVKKTLGIEGLVDICISNSFNLQTKPNPAMYLRAMSELGVSPKTTIVFEDSTIGIRAALDSCANVIPIAVFSNLTLDLVKSIYENPDQSRFI